MCGQVHCSRPHDDGKEVARQGLVVRFSSNSISRQRSFDRGLVDFTCKMDGAFSIEGIPSGRVCRAKELRLKTYCDRRFFR